MFVVSLSVVNLTSTGMLIAYTQYEKERAYQEDSHTSMTQVTTHEKEGM